MNKYLMIRSVVRFLFYGTIFISPYIIGAVIEGVFFGSPM